jgi:hypothetical protein
LSTSEYPQERLLRHFRDRATLLVPPNPAAAVLFGAVLYGRDPPIIHARRSRYTYGCQISPPFEPGVDPDSKRFTDADGTLRCFGRFNMFVRNGDTVEADAVQTNSFSPIFPDQPGLSFDFYRCSSRDPRYVDEESCEQIGSLTVDLGTAMQLPLDQRSVRVDMRFGDQFAHVFSPLRTLFSNLAGRLDNVERELREERGRRQQLEQYVRRLLENPRVAGEPDATRLEQILGELLQGQRDHGARLTALSKQRTAERLTSGEYMAHQDIKRRYEVLIGQDLLHVAATSRYNGPVSEAEARSWLAYGLFVPDWFERGPQHVYDWLSQHGLGVQVERFQSVWTEAAEIRAAADATGHRCVGLRRGAELHPGPRQARCLRGMQPRGPHLACRRPWLRRRRKGVRQAAGLHRPAAARARHPSSIRRRREGGSLATSSSRQPGGETDGASRRPRSSNEALSVRAQRWT